MTLDLCLSVTSTIAQINMCKKDVLLANLPQLPGKVCKSPLKPNIKALKAVENSFWNPAPLACRIVGGWWGLGRLLEVDSAGTKPSALEVLSRRVPFCEIKNRT